MEWADRIADALSDGRTCEGGPDNKVNFGRVFWVLVGFGDLATGERASQPPKNTSQTDS